MTTSVQASGVHKPEDRVWGAGGVMGQWSGNVCPCPQPALRRGPGEGHLLTQAEGGQSPEAWREGRSWTSVVEKLVLIDPWGQEVQLVVDEATGPGRSIPPCPGKRGSSLSHRRSSELA